MKERKHTPAPWVLIKKDDQYEGRHTIVADGEEIMCDMAYYPWCPENEYDWLLMTAAPELLEALERMIEAADDCGWSEDFLSAPRAAIAKARGEAQ